MIDNWSVIPRSSQAAETIEDIEISVEAKESHGGKSASNPVKADRNFVPDNTGENETVFQGKGRARGVINGPEANATAEPSAGDLLEEFPRTEDEETKLPSTETTASDLSEDDHLNEAESETTGEAVTQTSTQPETVTSPSTTNAPTTTTTSVAPSTAVNAAKPVATATAVPTPTPKPTAVPTATPKPTAIPTATPKPTAVPTAAPTATPKPTVAPTPVPTAPVSNRYYAPVKPKTSSEPANTSIIRYLPGYQIETYGKPSQADINHWISMFGNVPEWIKPAQTIRVVIVEGNAGIFYTGGGTWGTILGFTKAESATIYVSGNTRHATTAVHETAHVYDFYSGYLSYGNDFYSIYLAEGSKLPNNLKQTFNQFEFFAEGVAQFIYNNAAVKTATPRLYQYFNNLKN